MQEVSSSRGILPNIFQSQNKSNPPMSKYSPFETHRNQLQSSGKGQAVNQKLQNYYTSRSQFSQNNRNLSTEYQRRRGQGTVSLQQQQISDLERKIDLILMHNQRLETEKEKYRLLVEQLKHQNAERALTSNTARFVAQEQDFLVEKLRRELQNSDREKEYRVQELERSKSLLQEEVQTLSRLVEELSQERKDLKMQLKETALKTDSLTFQIKEECMRKLIDKENQLKDEFLLREIEFKNQLASLKDTLTEQEDSFQRKLREQREKFTIQQEQAIRSLEDKHNQQLQTQEAALREEFQAEKEQIRKTGLKNLQKEKEAAQIFIKNALDNAKQNDEGVRQEYQAEIEALRESLESRKKLIDSLLVQNKFAPSTQTLSQQDRKDTEQKQLSNLSPGNIELENFGEKQTQQSWFEEMLAMKDRLRTVTQDFLRESQLLKIKTAEKHDQDLRQLREIYEAKIELLVINAEKIQQENSQLRDIYQQALKLKIQQKKDFEIQRSKLKNLVRKLKVELQGIQEEFRLNIQGVRDQNNTFSMTMMKSMVEVKEKANFFGEENRKLRKAYEEHQRETLQIQQIAEQKVKYYGEKYEGLKAQTEQKVRDLKQELERLQQEAQSREQVLRENLNKEHELIHSLVQQLRADVQRLERENQQLRSQHNELRAQLKEKVAHIELLKNKVDELDANVERLKLDLEMAGVNDHQKTDTINQWKEHYDRIVEGLRNEKELINKKLVQKEEQLIELVGRYKALESQLFKANRQMNKLSLLEDKIVELGTDNNLIKNLAELFDSRKREPFIGQGTLRKENGFQESE